MGILTKARNRIAGLLDAHTGLRFVVAGAVNTFFGFAVYAAAIGLGLQVRAALLAGMVAGSVFNFFTTGGYAFRQLALRRYPAFVICYFTVYVVNVLLVEWLVPRVGGAMAAQAVSLVPMALLSYWLMARWVFAAPAR